MTTVPKQFYIFGAGISYTMSPTIHNAAFKYLRLPHRYSIFDSPGVDEDVANAVHSPTFGGASVTIPHKLAIQKLCDHVSESAMAIGAVNTLVVKDGKIMGDNTDWTGLVGVVNRKKNVSKSLDVGLVIGAGGASRAALYALHRLGVRTIYLANRTTSKAQAIADSMSSIFPIIVLPTMTSLPPTPPDIIVGTVPASATTISQFPPSLFESKNGIVVDMAYKPRMTPLLRATRKHAKRRWECVTGTDVLLEQGYGQFELWLGIEAPKKAMARALRREDRRRALKSFIAAVLGKIRQLFGKRKQS